MNFEKYSNKELIKHGLRDQCLDSEYELSNRLLDALNIIAILLAECKHLSGNHYIYTFSEYDEEHSISINEVERFLVDGQITTPSLNIISF